MRLAAVFVVVYCLFTSSLSFADPYGFAGCGVGTKLFGPREMQTSASTTNHGTVPIAQGMFIGLPTSQPWSISFDLAGCEENSKSIAYFDQYNYMFTNFSSLAREIAQGGGRSVDGLAAAFGCPSTVYGQFSYYLKSKFENIFSQPGVRASFLELRKELSGSRELVSLCNQIEEKKISIDVAGN